MLLIILNNIIKGFVGINYENGIDLHRRQGRAKRGTDFDLVILAIYSIKLNFYNFYH